MDSTVRVDRNHNLPTQLTSFVGRQEEVSAVKGLLASNRLISLTGSGGVGKTRIALEVASELAQVKAYRDGVWLAEFAGLSDSTLVPQTVASALMAHEVPGRTMADALLVRLTGRQLLLLLDNCEHVVEACARMVQRLLTALPDLSILATSREPLGVPGEIAWRVPSLALPDSKTPLAPEQLMECASVQLLVERAGAVTHDFSLAPASISAVCQVCQQLDGIPLAIELAAARLQVLTPRQLAERLGDVFHVLATGSRTAMPRQKTLWATVDWSYQLLSETERSLFRRCAVFVGGWTLDAAESVCAGGDIDGRAVLELLGQLVSKSLVVAEEHGGDERYRMLEPIRQFAVETLADGEEGTTARDRHLAWLVELGERAEAGLWGPAQASWLERLELEHDNIRAALQWSQTTGHAEAMLRLASALARFWDVRGFLTEGYNWLLSALEATPLLRTIQRAQGLARAGYLAVLRNDLAAADVHLTQALALAHDLQDEETVGAALMVMGMTARARGDYVAAARRFEQSLEMSRRAGHGPGVYTSLYLLASVDRSGKDSDRAFNLHQQSLALKQEQGDAWSVAASLFSLARLAEVRGDVRTAARQYRDSLAIRWNLRDRIGICVCLEGLAGVVAGQLDMADAVRAVTFLAAAERLREVIGHARREARQARVLTERLESALGRGAFAVAWRSGRELALDQVVEDALATPEPLQSAAPMAADTAVHPRTTPAMPVHEFRELVEDALRHLNDAPTLRQHRLLGVTPSTTGSGLHAAEAAALLQGDLLKAIDRLRPATPRPSPGSATFPGGWLHYLVLYESYVLGRENKHIMQRYYLSEGTFYRARKHAIDALAYDLAERAGQTPR